MLREHVSDKNFKWQLRVIQQLFVFQNISPIFFVVRHIRRPIYYNDDSFFW